MKSNYSKIGLPRYDKTKFIDFTFKKRNSIDSLLRIIIMQNEERPTEFSNNNLAQQIFR